MGFILLEDTLPKEWDPFFKIIAKARRQHARDSTLRKTRGVIYKFMKQVPSEYKEIYRRALAVAHWYPGQEHPGSDQWPTCALCVEYLKLGTGRHSVNECSRACPLVQVGEGCLDNEFSWFNMWRPNRSLEYATLLYEMLYKLYAEEWFRLKRKRLL